MKLIGYMKIYEDLFEQPLFISVSMIYIWLTENRNKKEVYKVWPWSSSGSKTMSLG